MPEAVKEVIASDAAAAEDTVPPAIDVATDGAVEVKPPPATEPSLPADQVQQEESNSPMEEVGETAPEVADPPTEESVVDKSAPLPTSSEAKKEVDPKKELEDMIVSGRAILTFKRDCFAAAEVLSKACEKASEIYGDISDHCAELYFLYGCSMLECGKRENTVLGESMQDKDAKKNNEDDGEDEDDEGVEDASENQEKADEAMEVDEVKTESPSSAEAGTSNGNVKDNDVEDVTKEDDEEDDSSLKVAWEMFELAKIAYTRLNNKEKLADTLMKLGEVGIESGHSSAMEDMITALGIRKELFPNKRILPETHFNIGLGYSMFELFDEAIVHFENSKSLLKEMIDILEKKGDEESIKEAKEIKDVLPDLQEKIQDMLESKQEKCKETEESLKNGVPSTVKEANTFSAGTSSEPDKPASNITHLIKRKRKIDEVTSDLPSKAVEEPKKKVKAPNEDGEEKSLRTDVTSSGTKPSEGNSGQLEASSEEPMDTEQTNVSTSTNEKSETVKSISPKKSNEVNDPPSHSIALETPVTSSTDRQLTVDDKSDVSKDVNTLAVSQVKCEEKKTSKIDLGTENIKEPTQSSVAEKSGETAPMDTETTKTGNNCDTTLGEKESNAHNVPVSTTSCNENLISQKESSGTGDPEHVVENKESTTKEDTPKGGEVDSTEKEQTKTENAQMEPAEQPMDKDVSKNVEKEAACSVDTKSSIEETESMDVDVKTGRPELNTEADSTGSEETDKGNKIENAQSATKADSNTVDTDKSNTDDDTSSKKNTEPVDSETGESTLADVKEAVACDTSGENKPNTVESNEMSKGESSTETDGKTIPENPKDTPDTKESSTTEPNTDKSPNELDKAENELIKNGDNAAAAADCVVTQAKPIKVTNGCSEESTQEKEKKLVPAIAKEIGKEETADLVSVAAE